MHCLADMPFYIRSTHMATAEFVGIVFYLEEIATPSFRLELSLVSASSGFSTLGWARPCFNSLFITEVELVNFNFVALRHKSLYKQ